MPVTFTAKGVAELYRANRRLWRGTPTPALLAAAAELIDAKSRASGTYSVRLEGATVSYASSASPVVINGSVALP